MKNKLYYEPMLDDNGKTMWLLWYGAACKDKWLSPIDVERLFPSSEWEYIAIKNDEDIEEC